MTSRLGRLYALAIAIFVFFLVWALTAARPWKSASPDPRLQQLALREQALRREAALVDRIVALRAASASTAAAAAPPPAVRIVHLPPLTVTRTS